MQIPDQSPEEAPLQASQPFYEFGAGMPVQNVPFAEAQPSTAVSKATVELSQSVTRLLPNEEAAILEQGYPPSPSFYQNMPAPAKPSPLPSPIAHRPLPPNVGGMYYPEQRAFIGTQPPPFVGPPPMPPQVKRSRGWIWIVAAFFSVALIASCSLCGWATYSLVSTSAQQVSGSINLANDYYSAIQAKNYDLAYSYLDPEGSISGLIQLTFTQQAQDVDTQDGDLLSYVVGQPLPDATASDSLHYMLGVTVHRTLRSYIVLLTMRKVDTVWKITDFDHI